jgi:ComF family protein
MEAIVALLDLLMPPACAGCGRSGSLLCDRCVGAFAPPFRAEDRFVAPDAGVALGDALMLALSAFAYAGPMRRALAALKYSGAFRLAPMLARPAAPSLRTLLAISGPAALVPVPVHAERRRERGYNQAELIARALGPSHAILERVRPTTKQHRLDRAARLANLRGAFRVASGVSVPSVAILVDDIITTTATLEACASVLREAGVEAVYGFAVAREV